jgi:hypothetical protein
MTDSIEQVYIDAIIRDGDGNVIGVAGNELAATLAAATDGTYIGDIKFGENLPGVNAATSGGCDTFNDIDLDETAVVVKASAGQVYSIHAVNLASSVRYLHLYNVAQGDVTVGTTVVKTTLAIPTSGGTDGAGFVWQPPFGLEFDTAITAAATTDIDGNAAPGANEVVVSIAYK